jgi:Predicted nucleic acid-binding protein, consists of a PIN domain and a Zn-ribbon module
MKEAETKDRNIEKYIADSAVFIMGNCNIPYSQMVTTPLVEDEIISEDARLRYDIAKAEGLRVEAIEEIYLEDIIKQAECTRDIERLSKTDLGILAKALEYNKKTNGKSILITDDFAVQNIAARLDIEVMPVAQRIITDKIIWQKQCIGCFRHFKDGDECPICGSPLRKKMKKKSAKKPKTI